MILIENECDDCVTRLFITVVSLALPVSSPTATCAVRGQSTSVF